MKNLRKKLMNMSLGLAITLSAGLSVVPTSAFAASTSTADTGLAASMCAATSPTTSNFYTATYYFTNINDYNNWVQQQYKHYNAPTPAQKPVSRTTTPTTVRVPVQKQVSAPVQSPTSNVSASTQVQQILALVNQERAKAGLAPLKLSAALDNMASAKAADMRDKNYFDHQSPTYGSPFDMMTKWGINYSYAGENIAAGQQSPADVMNSWMNSPGHRANILNPNYTELGVGLAKGGSYGTYWVQEFIRP
jgi:uncharacterized YkwD family protein